MAPDKDLEAIRTENREMHMLLHAVGTAQILLDELSRIQNKAKVKEVTYFKHDLKVLTYKYVSDVKGLGRLLNVLWDVMPTEDLERYITAKGNIIDKLQRSSLEDLHFIKELIDNAHRRYEQLDVFEKMLNTHCLPEVRDVYRQELGYTLDQYNEQKELQKQGYCPVYNEKPTV
jgi:hypothetical protein